ncbi:MAG: DUF4132 domain-containing protein [Propionibacteriaceae bacterium]|nr:DUF4132 domain-containing protein [Propionibacteriaceae bacterium]
MQRRLSLTEGTSDKFWYIDVAANAVTVRYGRRGTAGTTKTKTHETTEKALQDAEKQVASKLKKGYSDEDGAPVEALAPVAPTAASAPRKAPAKPAPAAAAPVDAAPQAALAEPEPLELPSDAQDIGWNVTPFDLAMNLNAHVTVEDDTEPFDPEVELARAKRIATRHKGDRARFGSEVAAAYTWTFSEPLFTTLPSAERATWWRDYLFGMDAPANQWGIFGIYLPPGISLALAARATGGLPREDVRDGGLSRLNLLGQRVLAPFVGSIWVEPAPYKHLKSFDIRKKNPWEVDSVDDEALIAAASLGGREQEVAEALARVEDKVLNAEYIKAWQYVVILAAATPEERVRLAERLGITFDEPPLLLAWLCSTGPAGFGVAVKNLPTNRAGADLALTVAGAAMTGPGAVPFFAAAAAGRHPVQAVKWLSEHIPQVLAAQLTAAQAVPLAATLRAVPVEQLRSALPNTTGGVRELVEQIIAEADVPELDPAVGWWAAAAADVTPGALPAWLNLHELPQLIVDGHRLTLEQVELLLRGLSQGTTAMISEVRQRASVRDRDRFAVALFDVWLANGAVAKDNWMMISAGLLGDDQFVHHLTPLIRQWPGESQHQRAVKGLDALRNVGSNTALQQISGIAAKVKFAGIKKRAGEAMEEIAQDLGLTRDQLEDRVLSDGGLDERGTREFSYGLRRFLAYATPEGKLAARLLDDEGRPTGKVLSSLPAALKAEDPSTVKEVRAEYNLLKKTVALISGVQLPRFEAAMVAGRRWTAEEFTAYIAPHPLLRRILAGVVWGLYDGAARVGLFRLDEDGSPVGADDELVELAGRAVGIVHRLELQPEELSLWRDVLADFELTAAFPQLDRPLFDLSAQQGDAEELLGLPVERVSAATLMGALTKRGWQRGAVLDNGIYSLYFQQFPAAGLTAVLEFEPGIWMGSMADQDRQQVTRVYLMDGVVDADVLGWGWHERWGNAKKLRRVPWATVPRVVVNEVLSAVHAIAP